MDWKPIDTAPKDGSRILLIKISSGHSGSVFRVCWASCGFWSDRFGNWNDGFEPSGLANPTHWVELPDADQINRSTNVISQ